jgi:hypothetical protein
MPEAAFSEGVQNRLIAIEFNSRCTEAPAPVPPFGRQKYKYLAETHRKLTKLNQGCTTITLVVYAFKTIII